MSATKSGSAHFWVLVVLCVEGARMGVWGTGGERVVVDVEKMAVCMEKMGDGCGVLDRNQS